MTQHLRQLAIIICCALLGTSCQIRRARTQAQLTRAAADGRAIVMALMAEQSDEVIISEEPTPTVEPGRFSSSTACFQHIVSRNPGIPFAVFSAGRIRPYKGTQAEEFGRSHNAWCIVEGAELGTGRHPFMFTANLSIQNTTDDPAGRLTDKGPFAEPAAVVVYTDGSVRIIEADKLTASHFYPCDPEERETHNVLRP